MDVVVHSLTKHLGGYAHQHRRYRGPGRLILKAAFAEFAQPDPTYHGIALRGPGGLWSVIRAQLLRDTGACISPFNAFLILQGYRDPQPAPDRHCANARRIAAFLQGIRRYPG